MLFLDINIDSAYFVGPKRPCRLAGDDGGGGLLSDADTKLPGITLEEVNALAREWSALPRAEEVRLAESRDYETDSRQNGWWLAELTECYRLGEDPAAILRIPDSFKLLTRASVQAAA